MTYCGGDPEGQIMHAPMYSHTYMQVKLYD